MDKQVRNYAWALLLVAGATLLCWPVREVLTLPNFTMVYILIVLIVAIRYGTGQALVAAFISFLSINYFMVQPYYTFLVSDVRELIDLVVFFIIAAVVGQLGARMRRQTEESRQRAYEQETLYRLTRSFNQLTTREGVFEALTEVLKETLGAHEVYILPGSTAPAASSHTTLYLLLQAANKTYGTLCAAFNTAPTPTQERLANTCASQAAMALQRIELTERASKSQQYEESDRLKTAILHAVSHDLRTPITVIKSSATNLRTLQGRLTPDQQREMAESIEQEADHLDKLVGNLLDMSRLRAGALNLNGEFDSLEEVVQEVAARAWKLNGHDRVKFAFPEDMPLVYFDYGLMVQALSNLVDNSVRYEPADSKVEICGSVVGDEIRLSIANHGEPIPEEDRQHIMEPFYRGKDGHTGLGLPIAKGIIEAHQGRLWVEDTPGGGVTFVIALPISNEKVKV